jgi:hypothetical protein
MSDPNNNPMMNVKEYSGDELNNIIEKLILEYRDTLEKALKAGAVVSGIKEESFSNQMVPIMRIIVVLDKTKLDEHKDE